MSVSTHQGSHRRYQERQDGHPRRRRGSGKRGRPLHGGAVRHAGGDQLHGPVRPGAHLPHPDRGERGQAPPDADGPGQPLPLRHRLHRLHRGEAGGHHRDLGGGPGHDDPRRRGRRRKAGRPGQPRPHLPHPRQEGRGPGADRPDGRFRRSGPPRRPEARRRHLRGHEGRRDDGPDARSGDLRPGARSEDRHDQGSHRLPDAARIPDPPGGDRHDSRPGTAANSS